MSYADGGKRLFDAVIASVGLVVLSPAILLLAIIVALHLGRPVIFRQQRPGRHGRLFTIYKFRTMRDAVDGQGRQLPDGARLTALGKWMRALSLDELPELWNVIRGEMSLVGPRPLLPQYLSRYTPRQARRHDVRPGITGWAQVNGRNEVEWERRFELDVWYVEHVSWGLDLRILFLTLISAAMRRGINQPGEATAREFTGTPPA